MSTLAKSETIGIVDLVLRADPGISPRIRDRALALLSHGSEDTALASEEVGASVFSAILGIDESTLSRWRRGGHPPLGPFPFTVTTDLGGRFRYIRSEAVAYILRHRADTTQAPAAAAPAGVATQGAPA